MINGKSLIEGCLYFIVLTMKPFELIGASESVQVFPLRLEKEVELMYVKRITDLSRHSQPVHLLPVKVLERGNLSIAGYVAMPFFRW